MVRTTTKGICHFCQQKFSKGSMARHLAACPKRNASLTETTGKAASPNARLLQLRVEGLYSPDYWMHLEIPANTPLQELDGFLRDSWLECCGHLSRFEIHGTSYSSYVDPNFGDKSMAAQIGKVVEIGDEFLHEYDFGSTTELRAKVLSERPNTQKQKTIELLAHNELPNVPCINCGQPATEVCSECIYENGGALCKKCAKQHECGEEMLLPIVNSPRVGVCGYDGPGL